MREDRIGEPREDEGLAVDPPNNTEPSANLSSLDSDATSPVDPPNNT